jgi:hypothetical protein
VLLEAGLEDKKPGELANADGALREALPAMLPPGAGGGAPVPDIAGQARIMGGGFAGGMPGRPAGLAAPGGPDAKGLVPADDAAKADRAFFAQKPMMLPGPGGAVALGDGKKQAKEAVAEGKFKMDAERVVRNQLEAILEEKKELDGKDADFGARRKRMGGRGGRGLGEEFTYAPLVIREYAHVRPPVTSGPRNDFTETLYWHPMLLLPDGKGDVSFNLCDSVTSFEVTVYAHTTDGRLGSATKTIESQLPLTVAAKMPVEVTAGDRIDVPVAVTNNTALGRQVSLDLTTYTGFDVLEKGKQTKLQVAAEGRGRQVMSLRPNLQKGEASLALETRTEGLTDSLREKIRVVPDGFPVAGASSDLLEKSATHKITLPTWMPGTLEVKVDVYPSTLADLQKGLEGLLREPNGCFEQTSTSNYPNVLVLDYLKTSDQPSDPATEKRTRDLLDRGYKKLTSFECQTPSANKRQGYEWFGGTAAPHEALTAYGLLQFHDMSKVHEVERDMLERTKAYLLSQRDGKGGFKRNDRALDTFGRAPEQITNAYIVWALSEVGVTDLDKELEALIAHAKTSDDPYFLALTALGLTNRGRKADATEMLKKVVAKQQEAGQLDAARTSITGSGGRDLVVETTALAVLGWLKTDALAFDAPIRKAVRWIGQQRSGEGAFGSTQATILALKAVIAWTKANKRFAEAGTLRLFVGDEKVAELPFGEGMDKPLSLTVPEAEKRLRAGVNTLRVEITGEKNVFPHTLGWSCRTTTPVSAKEQKVKLETKLAKTTLQEGETTRLSVKVMNVSGEHQGMATAIIGLPAGLIVPEDLKQLKEYCKLPDDGTRPLVSAFEIKGRELVLYWRDMAKGQTIDVPIDLIARVPGQYKGPASRAYLYYNADHKHWIEPLAVTIGVK